QTVGIVRISVDEELINLKGSTMIVCQGFSKSLRLEPQRFIARVSRLAARKVVTCSLRLFYLVGEKSCSHAGDLVLRVHCKSLVKGSQSLLVVTDAFVFKCVFVKGFGPGRR